MVTYSLHKEAFEYVNALLDKNLLEKYTAFLTNLGDDVDKKEKMRAEIIDLLPNHIDEFLTKLQDMRYAGLIKFATDVTEDDIEDYLTKVYEDILSNIVIEIMTNDNLLFTIYIFLKEKYGGPFQYIT